MGWEDKNGLQIKGEFVREIFGSIEIRGQMVFS